MSLHKICLLPSLDLYLFLVVEVKVVKRVEALIHPSLVSSHSAFDGDALGSRVQHKFLQVVELDLRRWCSLLTRRHKPKKTNTKLTTIGPCL